jgi:hypothetical protein
VDIRSALAVSVREMPRKFYHFTAKEYVPSILATGLTKGEMR